MTRVKNDKFITCVAQSAAKQQQQHQLQHDDNRWTLRGYLVDDISQCRTYMTYNILSEFMQLANVVGQLFALTKIFDGFYWTHGFDIMMGCQPNNSSFFDRFPSVVSCDLPMMYAFNGEQQKRNAICLLPLNPVNAEIFTVQWFLLTTVGLLLLVLSVYRLACICCPPIIEVWLKIYIYTFWSTFINVCTQLEVILACRRFQTHSITAAEMKKISDGLTGAKKFVLARVLSDLDNVADGSRIIRDMLQ